MDSKKKILIENGALNSEPETVQDELFMEKDFFDPEDLVQVKYEMLRRVKKEGHTVSRAAENFGFSRPAFYKIKEHFEKQGIVGLLPRKRGTQKAHKLTPEVIEYIKKMILEKEKADFKDLAKKVKNRFNIEIHPRSIRRVLKDLKKNTQKTDKPEE